MRYGKVIAWILTLAFLAAAVVIGFLDGLPQIQPEGTTLSFRIVTEAGEEQLSAWEQEGRYYVFLPGYARLSEVFLCLEKGSTLLIDGVALTDGVSCEGLPLGEDCAMTLITRQGQTTGGILTLMRSANVPAMHIDVRSGNMDYIHAEKGNAEPGTIRLYSPEGTLEHSGQVEAFNGRGNVTWENSPKKPYSLRLSEEADLLGMGAAKKWILMANGFDDSNLRNKTVYDFASGLGLACSPDCTWVDLYLNGEYAGLYLLSERNEIHPERVDIAETGSTLVSIDMEQRMARQNYPYILVDGDTALRLHSGEKVTDEMTTFWKSVDNAIQASDGIDPVTGNHYLDYIDLDSWVRKYLIEEVFGNVEASAVSHYFYIDGNDPKGKIYAGPVWDYDYALGSTRTWQTSTVQGLFCQRPYVWDEEDTPWFYALWQKEEFRAQVIEDYKTEVRPRMQTLLETGLEQYLTQIEQAARMNQKRWNLYVGPAEEETQRIREYLTARLNFLDSMWLEGEAYYTVTANMTNGSVVSCYAVKPGETLPQLPDLSWETDAIGWYDYDTDEPFDVSQPINESGRIYLKRQEAIQTEEGRLKLILRYAPGAALVLLLIAACLMDRSQRKRTDKRNYERTNANQISS